jgi:hypothetical protein
VPAAQPWKKKTTRSKIPDAIYNINHYRNNEKRKPKTTSKKKIARKEEDMKFPRQEKSPSNLCTRWKQNKDDK